MTAILQGLNKTTNEQKVLFSVIIVSFKKFYYLFSFRFTTMKKILFSILSLCSLVLFLGSCNSNRVPVEQIETMTQTNNNKASNNRLERIANAWEGHFSNRKQVESGKSEMTIEQELIGRRIWKKSRIGERWIYMGWYSAGSYANPLTNSIAEITKVSPDTSFITFYRIPESKELDPYEWVKAAPYEHVQRSELISNGDDCGCYIVRGEKGGYRLMAKGACNDDISDQLKYYRINATIKSDKITFDISLLDEHQQKMVHYKNNVFNRMNKKELERKYELLPLTSL